MVEIRALPPATTETGLWLQAVHAELQALRILLTPAAPPESEDGTVELREPETPAKPATAKAKR